MFTTGVKQPGFTRRARTASKPLRTFLNKKGLIRPAGEDESGPSFFFGRSIEEAAELNLDGIPIFVLKALQFIDRHGRTFLNPSFQWPILLVFFGRLVCSPIRGTHHNSFLAVFRSGSSFVFLSSSLKAGAEGIFRISGNVTVIEALRAEVESGYPLELSHNRDPYDVASLIKVRGIGRLNDYLRMSCRM